MNAKVGRNGKAEIKIDAKRGSVKIAESSLNAEVHRNGKAEITIDAGRNVTIWRSSLNAQVRRNGEADVTINAATGNVRITEANLKAEVHNGSTTITIDAENDITISRSRLDAKALHNGKAEVILNANTGNVSITNADIEAVVKYGTNPSNFAGVSITAGGAITIDPSNITAQVYDGIAEIVIGAGGPVTITDSNILATVTDVSEGAPVGLASITIEAGASVNIVGGVIVVTVVGTGGDITISDSNIGATGNGSDVTSIVMAANGNITMDPSTIIAQGDEGLNGSTVTLIAANGSIIGINDGPDDIQTEYLNLFASDSIYGDYSLFLGGTNFLTTNAQYITALAANNIQIYDNGPVTLVSVVVTNYVHYGNVTLESLNGDIVGANQHNANPPDILAGDLFLNAFGSIYGNYPPAGSLTTNAIHITVSANGNIYITDNKGINYGSPTSTAFIDIVANGTITVDYVQQLLIPLVMSLHRNQSFWAEG